jgi:catechol 2,3-dioxygenase-like lactoylglutathione lyase family enzyme
MKSKFGLGTPCAIVLSFALGMVLQSARGSSDTKDATRVTGVGGFFFKADNPAKLADWYRTHLGIALVAAGKGEHAPQYYPFRWRDKDHPETIGATALSIFPSTTKYLGPDTTSFMVDFRVANLEQLLAQLKQEGVMVDDKIDDESNGRFAWLMDPEGHRIELWEPKGE